MDLSKQVFQKVGFSCIDKQIKVQRVFCFVLFFQAKVRQLKETENKQNTTARGGCPLRDTPGRTPFAAASCITRTVSPEGDSRTGCPRFTAMVCHCAENPLGNSSQLCTLGVPPGSPLPASVHYVFMSQVAHLSFFIVFRGGKKTHKTICLAEWAK